MTNPDAIPEGLGSYRSAGPGTLKNLTKIRCFYVNYDNLTRRVDRRAAKTIIMARYGLRWERDSIPKDWSLNRDFVGFEPNETLSVGSGYLDELSR